MSEEEVVTFLLKTSFYSRFRKCSPVLFFLTHPYINFPSLSVSSASHCQLLSFPSNYKTSHALLYFFISKAILWPCVPLKLLFSLLPIMAKSLNLFSLIVFISLIPILFTRLRFCPLNHWNLSGKGHKSLPHCPHNFFESALFEVTKGIIPKSNWNFPILILSAFPLNFYYWQPPCCQNSLFFCFPSPPSTPRFPFNLSDHLFIVFFIDSL